MPVSVNLTTVFSFRQPLVVRWRVLILFLLLDIWLACQSCLPRTDRYYSLYGCFINLKTEIHVKFKQK